MSRRARWSLLLSCCGLAALVAPSAWGVLTAGAASSSAKASVGVTPEVALVSSSPQRARTAPPEPRAASSETALSRPGVAAAASRALPAGAGSSAESSRAPGAEALAQRAR